MSRGIYVDQLKTWMDFYHEDQILILSSESLFEQTSDNFERILEFLNLPTWAPKQFTPVGQAKYPDMKSETRKRLRNYFEPHNERLYKYLGVRFGWNT